MNNTYLSLLLLLILSSCHSKKQQKNVAEVTFQIDMSQVIADIANPERTHSGIYFKYERRSFRA